MNSDVLPRILIIDDLLGRTHSDRRNEERANFCGHPSGLLVGEYKEQQMVGDRETGLEQHSNLETVAPDPQQ